MELEIKDFESRFNRIINEKTINNLNDVLILKESLNEYNLFNKYVIEKVDNKIITYNKNTDVKHDFTSVKNAMAWCILDKRNKFYEANRLLALDRTLKSLEVDIKLHKNLFLKSKEKENKFIYLAKLNEDKVKVSVIKKEIYGFLQEVDRWQRKKFEQNSVNN